MGGVGRDWTCCSLVAGDDGARTQEREEGRRMSGQAHANRVADVAVLGAGTAGLAAYRAASALTRRVVLIEGGVAGTTCARVGCMPSKLLLAAAEAAHHARHAGPFGVECSVRVDGRAVMDRVRRERDRFVGFVVAGVESISEGDKLRGYARFVAPGVLEVGSSRVVARATVIATGSSPIVPPMFDGVRDRLVVNDDVFSWESLPESVAVFGTGVIGVELGQALHRLGVRVRVFGRRGKVGPISDPVVRAAALAAFRCEMPIDPDARVRAVRRSEAGVEVHFEAEDGMTHVESFACCLAATGRRPNLDRLALENAGVALDAKGIPRFDRTTLQAGSEPVFVAGDVNEDVPFLHEAADEGRIAGENAARFPDVTPGLRRSPLSITFSEPQIATAGSSFESLGGQDFAIGQVGFEDQGRSRIMLQNRGVLRVYATRERFLGAEMVGPRAEHLGHLLAWAHQQRMTIPQMLSMPFYHPVVEEGLRTALRDVAAKLAVAIPTTGHR
jgi:dihydrolipoamide dehydrogenase